METVMAYDDEEVLVSIGKKAIKNKDLDRIIEKYPVEKRIYFQTEAGRKQLLEQKIAFTLFSEYAKELKKDEEEAFVLHINDLKEQMLTQIVMNELFQSVAVSDEEVLDFYNNNEEKFVLEETVAARHILVKTEEEAKSCLKEIVEDNKDFSEVAKAHSMCPSKEQGGLLNYFKRGMMVKEFEDEAFSLPLHKVSQPVKTQFGYHIIEVMDKTEEGVLGFEEVKEKIKAQLVSEKKQAIYEKKLIALKAQYGFREVNEI